MELADIALFYKNVMELPPDERPTDDVIANDKKLNAHLMDLERKRAS